jgi:hypothetical protein
MNANSSSQFRVSGGALALPLLTIFISTLNAAGPPTITSFQRLDPSSGVNGPYGWSIDAAAGKILIGDDAQFAYLYDVATRHKLFTLQGTDTQLNDRFGISVALSADYALVGANQKQAAYVFDVHTGQQLQKFSDPNAPPTFGFGFGISTAISGNIAVVGDIGDDTQSSDAGAVYVYNILSGQLLRTMYTPSNNTLDVQYGSSVDMEGNFMVVGAAGAHEGGPSHTGAAYVYDASGNYLRTLQPTGPSHAFGHSIEIVGNLAMISDYNPSSAYLFDLQTGQQLRKFVSPNPNTNDGFGHSIAFDGQRALIGDWTAQVNGVADVGTAYLFDVGTGDLLATLQPQELHSFDDAFGYSVAMNGNTLIASALSGEGIVFLTTVPEPTTITLVGLSFVIGLSGSRFRLKHRGGKATRL